MAALDDAAVMFASATNHGNPSTIVYRPLVSWAPNSDWQASIAALLYPSTGAWPLCASRASQERMAGATFQSSSAMPRSCAPLKGAVFPLIYAKASLRLNCQPSCRVVAFAGAARQGRGRCGSGARAQVRRGGDHRALSAHLLSHWGAARAALPRAAAGGARGHAGRAVGADDQSLLLTVYDMREPSRPVRLSHGALPLSSQATLEWVGFGDKNQLATVDSAGVVRQCVRSAGYEWVPLLHTEGLKKSKAEHHWVVGLTSSQLMCARALKCRISLGVPIANCAFD
eukprot:4604979-Pleurochrysis_carterae.AAC.3